MATMQRNMAGAILYLVFEGNAELTTAEERAGGSAVSCAWR